MWICSIFRRKILRKENHSEYVFFSPVICQLWLRQQRKFREKLTFKMIPGVVECSFGSPGNFFAQIPKFCSSTSKKIVNLGFFRKFLFPKINFPKMFLWTRRNRNFTIPIFASTCTYCAKSGNTRTY